LTSKTTRRFREAYRRLPEQIQRRAREAYRRFTDDPNHPSLHFKQVHASRPIYAARVGLGYRALALVDGETAIWFWIGTHAEYDQLLRAL
jgi:mRNA-degrading endonuclease RelE of RelBE toxin-antitoxin system